MKIIGRDEIALEVMKCLLARQHIYYQTHSTDIYYSENTEAVDELIAKRSYEIANAMILERDKRYAENYVLNASPDSAPTVQKA